MSYRIHYFSSLLFLIVSSVTYGVEPVTGEVASNGDWWDGMSLYAGAGIGQSYVDSELNVNTYSAGNQIQNAWKLSAGLDINKYFSVESFYAVLGSEELNPGAGAGHRMTGLDVMLHYWAYGSGRTAGSIALYAKAGLSHQTNKARDVRYQNETKVPVLGGIGAEVYLPKQFSFRLELESYDTDAALVSFNVVKRFGFKSRAPIPKKPVIKRVVLTPVVLDSDLDGILDDEDQCLGTAKDVLINEFGCAID